MKKLLAALTATTLFAGSALAQAPAPKPAPVPIKLAAHPALWVVKDSDTTIYLMGTVHVLKPGTTWLEGGVKKAYDASPEIVLELLQPDTPTMQGLIGKYGIDPDGPALTAKLSPAVKSQYEKTTADLGLPAPAFEKFQPWFVSTILSLTAITKAGYDPESGVERQITAAAMRDHKRMSGLETAEEQLGFFASLPEDAQLKFLKSTLDELKQVDGVFNAMIADWAKGDPDALARLLNASMNESPEVVKALLTDRNARWAKWIDARMKQPGTLFIAVGAGHLAGTNSVQNMLKAYKLKAVRIPS